MGSPWLRELDKYDVVQLSLTSLSGAVRHVTLPSHKLKTILQSSGTVRFGSSGIPADSLLYDLKSSVGDAEVDLTSLRPLPWLCGDGRTAGGAMCHVSPASPRAAAIEQVARLKDEFGLTIRSAFEAEYMIFEQDETTPFNNVLIEPYGRSDNMSGREATLLTTCHSLEGAGLPVETFMTEFAAAQFELTFRPEEGVASADTIMVMKDGVKSNLRRNGMMPTYMACPLESGHANGFHLNHSLWTADGANAFIDVTDPINLSELARHWIAGLVHHAPALTALLCPTVNCYRRLADVLCPQSATWGEENRRAFLRLKTERKNVYLENRLPSSASNPYLDLAATLAAGMDGLARKLTCPVQIDPEAPPIHKSIDAAVSALEQDEVLTQALGEDLVKGFINISKKAIKARDTGHSSHQFHRSVYFHAL